MGPIPPTTDPVADATPRPEAEAAPSTYPSAPRRHRWARAICARYPFALGDDWVSRGLDPFFGAGHDWQLATGRGGWPTMVLDLAHTLQRKFYYFPRVHGRIYRRLPFREYLIATLTAGAGFLDIGANVGFFSLLAAELVGASGRVYGFEPDPRICESLTRSARANRFAHLETFQLALSDHEGQADFYRAKDGTAGSLVPEAPGREARYAGTLTTPVTTLDALVAAGRIDPARISLLKIDVEGEEPRTVAGLLDTLVQANHPPIWCEVRGPQGSTRAPNTFVAVRDRLAPLGYEAFTWSRGERRPARAEDVVKRTDILFERDRRAPRP